MSACFLFLFVIGLIELIVMMQFVSPLKLSKTTDEIKNDTTDITDTMGLMLKYIERCFKQNPQSLAKMYVKLLVDITRYFKHTRFLRKFFKK